MDILKYFNAIIAVLESVNLSTDLEDVKRYINNDFLTLNKTRSGRAVIWYLDDDGLESCIYTDALIELTPEEIKEELL